MSGVDLSSLEAADAQARLVAQTHFEKPLLLVAGAGTGKTTALVARVVGWCVGPGWERAEERARAGISPRDGDRIAADLLGRVVAITFTEAAAAEMAERVGKTFSQLATGVEPVGLQIEEQGDALRARARILLGALDHLRVSTIHSFCRSLLARYPLGAGLHPRFEVDADEHVHTEVVRDVMTQAIARADATPESSELLALASAGFPFAKIEAALFELLQTDVAPERLAVDPISPERVHAELLSLGDAVAGLWSCVSEALNDDDIAKSTEGLLDALSYTRDELHPKEISANQKNLEDWLGEFCAEWDARPYKQLVKWSKQDFLKGEAELLGDLQLEAAEKSRALLPLVNTMRELDPGRIEQTREVLVPLLSEARNRLRERGALPYAALLSGARDLLARNPQLRGTVRAGIDQLMVDEFQDTDPVQCEIIRCLALDGAPEDRPGLFLVGDPKQSIYGWRSADLRAYDGFAQELENAGGLTQTLSVNFRSAKAILDEVQRVIEPVMIREPGLQPSFEPLAVCPERVGDAGFDRGGFAPVEHWVSWEWDASKSAPAGSTLSARATAIEANALGADIRRLHDEEGVAWGEVGVLFRAQSDLDEYLAALREWGVPYAVERDRSYFRRREIIDASALVQCVLDPNDTLALLTFLRSPAVGVPDAAWIRLFAGQLPRRAAELDRATPEAIAPLAKLFEETAATLRGRSHELPGIEGIDGWQWSAIAGIETLAALRESFGHDPADRFVERMRALHLGEVTEASRHLGAFRVANLERFYRDLSASLCEGESVEALLRRLRADVALARESEESGPKTDELDAVRVMTIHKSKGLDFEHVYVLQLHKSSGRGGASEQSILQEGDRLEYRLFGTATLGYQREQARAAEVEDVERVRTLYVAMTRAKRRLVLAGCWKGSDEPVAPSGASAAVDLLRSRAGLEEDAWRDSPTLPLADWMIGLAAGDSATSIRENGACWRFPDLDRPSPPSASAGRRSLGLESDAILRSNGQRLKQRRQAALERMRRPWQRAASSAVESKLPRRFSDPEDVESPDSIAADAAAAAGTLVHGVFEDVDLAGDLAAQFGAALTSEEAMGASADALTRARETLERFVAGPLFEPFSKLCPQIIARELPVWLAPADDTGPVAAVSGVIDLVYRDDAGDWVIVDYKTDRVEGEALVARAQAYAEQGRVYADALETALGTATRPRFELWFLHAGEVVAVDV